MKYVWKFLLVYIFISNHFHLIWNQKIQKQMIDPIIFVFVSLIIIIEFDFKKEIVVLVSNPFASVSQKIRISFRWHYERKSYVIFFYGAILLKGHFITRVVLLTVSLQYEIYSKFCRAKFLHLVDIWSFFEYHKSFS